MAPEREPLRVGIVPHTHWDREWYLPFETFRHRLVGLLDELLDMLERDPSYARFLLDGQTVVLDDYLEVRPEAADRLRRLAAQGRLTVGPWMVLMDEFMVSGETIVRDLQLGLARASEFGGASPVGYLPDMFGHVGQMPQILRLAGLEHAVVWRGVPRAVDRTGFWWEAPDGSRVRAEYLYGSYSNGRDLPADAKQLVGRARDYEAELGDVRAGDLLLMNGTDHQLPQPWLGRVVAEANAIQDDYRFEVTSLGEYLAHQPTADLPVWAGELRSGARANLLMGVASNRVDVHRAAAHAERALEHRAEPAVALFGSADASAERFLDRAWRLLVLNSAHDSSCACSADEVVDEVVTRYRQVRQIGDALTRDALAQLASQVDAPRGSTVVANPTARDRAGVVDASVPGTGPVHFVDVDGTPRPTQLVEETGGTAFSEIVEGRKVRWIVGLMRGPEFAGRSVARWTTERRGDGRVEIVLTEAGPTDDVTDLGELREHLGALGDEGATVHVRLQRAARRRVLVDTGPVPGHGWTTLRAVDGEGPPGTVAAAADGTLTNDRLRVRVDPGDGTWSIQTDGLSVGGLGRLVDGGDGGDTYNYSPPAEDRVVDHPVATRLQVVEPGPVRARLRVERDYEWPVAAVGDEYRTTRRSDETVLATVVTTLTLQPGEPFVRVRTELDHRVRDHRLRVHFPLPAPVAGSDAECAFHVVRRGLTAEGGPQEPALATFPSRRFVDASDGRVGLAILHDGLAEYEVTGDGTELAVTLLRATGYLSRGEPALRPNPAGPLLPLEGPQLQGTVVADHAVLLHRGDWRTADCHGAADAFLLPLERTRVGPSTGARPATGRALRVHGGEVTSVRHTAGAVEVRVHRTDPDPGPVAIEHEGAPASGWVVDLRGRPVAPFEGGVELGPWQIATLRLRDPATS